MQWRFNPPAAQPGTRYALRKQNQIIVYLFEENGFSIVFMGPNSGLSGCYTLGRARAHYWAGGILSNTLLVNITGQFSRIFSIVDIKAYFDLRIQIMFVFTVFSENMRISPPAPSRPGQPVAKFQRPAVERLVAGRRALVRGGAGSFNQHLGPCFTNSVVPLPIFKLSTRSGRGHTAAQPAQPPSPHHKTETKRLLIFLGCIKQRLKSTQI